VYPSQVLAGSSADASFGYVCPSVAVCAACAPILWRQPHSPIASPATRRCSHQHALSNCCRRCRPRPLITFETILAQRLTACSTLFFFQAQLHRLPGNVGHASVWVVPSRDAGSRCIGFDGRGRHSSTPLHSLLVPAASSAQATPSHPRPLHRPLLGISRAVLMH